MFATALPAFLLALTALLGVHRADGGEVLVVLPNTVDSYLQVNTALPRALAERGHKVTLVVPREPRGDNSVFAEIIQVGNYEESNRGMLLDQWRRHGPWLIENMDSVVPPIAWPFVLLHTLWDRGHLAVVHALHHPDFRSQVLDKPGRRFDLVIAEVLSHQEALLGLAHRFDAPLVAVQAHVDDISVAKYMGGPTHPAYVPNRFLAVAGPMDILQRAVNLAASAFIVVEDFLYHLPGQRHVVRQVFPEAPPLDDLVQTRLALAVLHSHPAFTQAQAMPPNVIYAPGLHIGRVRPLSPPYRDLLTNATHGVVLFSLGSAMDTGEMGPHVGRALMEALASLPQRVLVRWTEGRAAPSPLPDNVRLVTEWMPQTDILAHSNTRLLVTACGHTGVLEALWFGVPVLCIPRFGDQFATAALVEHHGVGKVAHSRTEPVLRRLLHELLAPGSKVRERARRMSRLLRMRPAFDATKAVQVVEDVMANGTAPLLRPASAGMYLHEVLLIDIAVVAGLVALALLLLVIAFVYEYFYRKKKMRKIRAAKRKEEQKKIE